MCVCSRGLKSLISYPDIWRTWQRSNKQLYTKVNIDNEYISNNVYNAHKNIMLWEEKNERRDRGSISSLQQQSKGEAVEVILAPKTRAREGRQYKLPLSYRRGRGGSSWGYLWHEDEREGEEAAADVRQSDEGESRVRFVRNHWLKITFDNYQPILCPSVSISVSLSLCLFVSLSLCLLSHCRSVSSFLCISHIKHNSFTDPEWQGPWWCRGRPRCRWTCPQAGCRWSASPNTHTISLTLLITRIN